MSSANVLPSAPQEKIYPVLPTQPDFRMQKVNEISASLNKEVGHYRAVAKKYKRASFGSALSAAGLPATIPLGGVGGAFALASSGFIIVSKRLDCKIKKHQEIVTLAIAKRDTVDRLVFKALADNRISDSEFQLIMTEFSQYNVLKEAVRAKLTRQPSKKGRLSSPDKINKDICDEIKADYQKKIDALTAISK